MAIGVLENISEGMTLNFDITVRHPLFDKFSPIWEKCRDFREGSDSVKFKGVKYLPKLNGQDNIQYESYKERAMFFNGTGRTVEAYLGMIFRKDPEYNFTYNGQSSVELNDEMMQFLDSVTHDGLSLDTLIHQATEEVIVTNRVGILVDMPEVDTEAMSLLEYEQMNIKPILSMYRTENIINWYWQIIENKVVPIMFVLFEPVTQLSINTLKHESIERYRILYLENAEDPQARRYKSMVVEKIVPSVGTELGFRVLSVNYPQKDGNYLPFIPFYVLSDRGLDYRSVYRPMVKDLVDVNHSSFLNSADHENELHWTSLKTLVFPGWDKSVYGDPVVGGALASPEGQIPLLLEPTSDSALQVAISDKNQMMSILGAERISQKGRYLPSAETARITASTESSVLLNMINFLSHNFTKIVQFMVDWSKPAMVKYQDGELKVTVRVSDDLSEDNITFADFRNAVDVLQRGGISFDSFFYNMKRREMYPDNWTKDQEMEAIIKTRDAFLDQAVESEIAALAQNALIRPVTEQKVEAQERSETVSVQGRTQTVTELGDKARVRIS